MNSVDTATLGLIADQLACGCKGGKAGKFIHGHYRTVEDSMAFELAGKVRSKPS
jgi:hypothetical protein